MKYLTVLLTGTMVSLTGIILAGTLAFGFLKGESVETSGQPDVVMESLDQSVVPYEHLWHDEIGRRFHNAVGIIVHGGDFVEGQWIVGTSWQPWKHVTSAEEVLTHYENLYPGRTIVFVSCNPGHIHLHGHPRVYYALDSVWVYPDRVAAKEGSEQIRTFDEVNWAKLLEGAQKTRWEVYPDYVGSIFEFVNAQ